MKTDLSRAFRAINGCFRPGGRFALTWIFEVSEGRRGDEGEDTSTSMSEVVASSKGFKTYVTTLEMEKIEWGKGVSEGD